MPHDRLLDGDPATAEQRQLDEGAPRDTPLGTDTRESILAEMEAEIAAAIDRAFTRLSALDEQPASQSPGEGSPPSLD